MEGEWPKTRPVNTRSLYSGSEIRYATDEEVPTMTTQELETVALYVKDHLPDWLERPAATTVPSDYLRLGERLLRVEEAIKNQNLLMEKRFEAMDKRFEDLIHMIDKRFEDLTHQMDKRFEDMNKRFEDLTHQMDKRFEAMDKRFEDMNKRFEAMDRRFEHISKQVSHSFGWTIAIMSGLFVALGVLITAYRFLGAVG